MNDNINNTNNDSSVVVFQPNKFGNSSTNNSHNSVVTVDSSQSSDCGNTECSEVEFKTSPSKTTMVLGVHSVISSPEGHPTSPLNPPSQPWIATTTSITTYSLSPSLLAEFSAQYSLPSAAAAARHKSHVQLETSSAATKDSVKNIAYTIKDKVTIVVRSSRNGISKTKHTSKQTSKIANHNCRNMLSSATFPFILILANAHGGQSTELGQSYWKRHSGVKIAFANYDESCCKKFVNAVKIGNKKDCEPVCTECVRTQTNNTFNLGICLGIGCSSSRWRGLHKGYDKFNCNGCKKWLETMCKINSSKPCKQRTKRRTG